MVGGENLESRSNNSREYNNSTDFNESGKAKEFLNIVDKTDGAKEMATELKKGDFEKNMLPFGNRGKEIREKTDENNFLEKFKNCPSTSENVSKPSNGEKPVEDIVKGMGAMAKDIGMKNSEFTHKGIDKNTGGIVTADLQGKIGDETNTVTYLSDCNYGKGSGSDKKCLIHSYGDPVYYADPPVDFS